MMIPLATLTLVEVGGFPPEATLHDQERWTDLIRIPVSEETARTLAPLIYSRVQLTLVHAEALSVTEQAIEAGRRG